MKEYYLEKANYYKKLFKLAHKGYGEISKEIALKIAVANNEIVRNRLVSELCENGQLIEKLKEDIKYNFERYEEFVKKEEKENERKKV